MRKHALGYENMKKYVYLTDNEYEAKVRCHNCGEIFIIAVPKGKTIKQECETRACYECGCTTMVKY